MNAPDSPVNLFVYGTLKRGYRNHRLIADQQFVGEATSEPYYRLVDVGPYPGLIHDEETGLAVRGELWIVSACALAELDDFEMSTDDYTREPIALVGIAEPVWAYYFHGSLPTDASTGAEWPFDQ